MNENPEGTPNPLNPAPSFGRVEKAPETGEAMGTGTPEVVETLEAASFTEAAKPAEAPAETPAKPAPAAPAPRVNHSVVDPMMRPVKPTNNFDTLEMDEVSIEELTEDTIATPNPVAPAPAPAPVNNAPELVAKDSIVEPAGKKGSKKKAFVIGGIILAIIAIICGAAAIAIFVLNGSNSDRVAKAIDKLLNGEVPSLVTINGNISSTPDDPAAENSTNISFNGSFDTVAGANTLSATVNAKLTDGTSTNFEIGEVRTKNGDTFFKLDGINNLLDSADPEFSVYSNMLGVVDDQWILISDNFGESMNSLQVFDNQTTCLINAFGTLPNYSKDIVNKYKQNQFITYSTDKLEIAKKNNELYRIGVDSDKLTAFINSLSNNGFMNELNACTGNTATNSEISVDSVKEIFNGLPTVYVEVDGNNDFTRVYFKANTTVNGTATSTSADLDILYPQKIEITEPEDYVDMSTLLNSVLTNLLTAGE